MVIKVSLSNSYPPPILIHLVRIMDNNIIFNQLREAGQYLGGDMRVK